MRTLARFTALLLTSQTLLAANQPSTDATDGMLDRLERKLLEQEAATLKIQAPPRSSPINKNQQKLRLPEQSYTGRMPEGEDFSIVDRKIQDIEAQTEDLSQRIEKLQASILDKSQRGAYVEIQIELEDVEATALRELTVSIDQHTLYQLGKTINPWLPQAQILAYSGPLEPGTHKLKLQAQTLRKYSDKLPLDTNLFHNYNQEISLDIPQGIYRKGYKLKLTKPEKQNTYAQANMENYEIP